MADEQQNNPARWTDIALVVVTVGNLVISVLLWSATYQSTRTAQHVFEAAYRPYLVADDFSLSMDDQHRVVSVGFKIRNEGTVHATFSGSYEIDTCPNVTTPQSLNDFLPPHQVAPMLARMTGAFVACFQRNPASLKIRLDLRYKGVTNEQYCYHVERDFNPMFSAFELKSVTSKCD